MSNPRRWKEKELEERPGPRPSLILGSIRKRSPDWAEIRWFLRVEESGLGKGGSTSSPFPDQGNEKENSLRWEFSCGPQALGPSAPVKPTKDSVGVEKTEGRDLLVETQAYSAPNVSLNNSPCLARVRFLSTTRSRLVQPLPDFGPPLVLYGAAPKSRGPTCRPSTRSPPAAAPPRRGTATPSRARRSLD